MSHTCLYFSYRWILLKDFSCFCPYVFHPFIFILIIIIVIALPYHHWELKPYINNNWWDGNEECPYCNAKINGICPRYNFLDCKIQFINYWSLKLSFFYFQVCTEWSHMLDQKNIVQSVSGSERIRCENRLSRYFSKRKCRIRASLRLGEPNKAITSAMEG